VLLEASETNPIGEMNMNTSIHGKDATKKVESQTTNHISLKELLRKNVFSRFEMAYLPSAALTRKRSTVRASFILLAAAAHSPAAFSAFACDNDNFKSSVTGGFLPTAPTPDYLAMDITPLNTGGWTEHCYPTGQICVGAPRYKTVAQFNNVRNWRGKVCANAIENAANTHWVSYQTTFDATCPTGGSSWCSMYIGPQIGFQYRGADGVWRLFDGVSAWTVGANDTKWYQWSASFSTPKDFRIIVNYAKANDRFDLMMDK
jgi:hypothetical protein